MPVSPDGPPHLTLRRALLGGKIIVVSWLRTLWGRAGRSLAQSHTAAKWVCFDLGPAGCRAQPWTEARPRKEQPDLRGQPGERAPGT